MNIIDVKHSKNRLNGQLACQSVLLTKGVSLNAQIWLSTNFNFKKNEKTQSCCNETTHSLKIHLKIPTFDSISQSIKEMYKNC